MTDFGFTMMVFMLSLGAFLILSDQIDKIQSQVTTLYGEVAFLKRKLEQQEKS